MALQWGDNVPAWLAAFLPGWHPVWTLASRQTHVRLTRGPTTTQRWANRLPYDVEQALVYSIDVQPLELRHQVAPGGRFGRMDSHSHGGAP